VGAGDGVTGHLLLVVVAVHQVMDGKGTGAAAAQAEADEDGHHDKLRVAVRLDRGVGGWVDRGKVWP